MSKRISVGIGVESVKCSLITGNAGRISVKQSFSNRRARFSTNIMSRVGFKNSEKQLCTRSFLPLQSSRKHGTLDLQLELPLWLRAGAD